MTSQLESLARRCETEGPSKELDTCIGAGLDIEPTLKARRSRTHFTGGKGKLLGYTTCWPAYTTSLDGAVALVPDGCWKEVTGPRHSLNIPSPVPNFWRVQLAYGGIEDDIVAWAATEALALCAAALRARAALSPSADEVATVLIRLTPKGTR